MKQCPKCSKTYDDTWGVCINDREPLTQLEPDKKPELLKPNEEMLKCYKGLLKHRFYVYGFLVLICASIPLFDFSDVLGTVTISLVVSLAIITRWAGLREVIRLQNLMNINPIGNVFIAFLFSLETAISEVIRDFRKKYSLEKLT